MIEKAECVRIRCDGFGCDKFTEWFKNDESLKRVLKICLETYCGWTFRDDKAFCSPFCSNYCLKDKARE